MHVHTGLPDLEFSVERTDLQYSVDIGRRFSLTCSSPESDPFQGDVNWLFDDTSNPLEDE